MELKRVKLGEDLVDFLPEKWKAVSRQ